jgi:hypothetical protein
MPGRQRISEWHTRRARGSSPNGVVIQAQKYDVLFQGFFFLSSTYFFSIEYIMITLFKYVTSHLSRFSERWRKAFFSSTLWLMAGNGLSLEKTSKTSSVRLVQGLLTCKWDTRSTVSFTIHCMYLYISLWSVICSYVCAMKFASASRGSRIFRIIAFGAVGRIICV